LRYAVIPTLTNNIVDNVSKKLTYRQKDVESNNNKLNVEIIYTYTYTDSLLASVLMPI